MKRYSLILVFLLLSFGLPAAAQKELKVNSAFKIARKETKGTTEVMLKGSKLKSFDLTLFHSVTIPIKYLNVTQTEADIHTDTAHALEKEEGRKSGRLYYGFYRLPPKEKDEPMRYLFYRNNALRSRQSSAETISIIYMEGYASIAELKRRFSK